MKYLFILTLLPVLVSASNKDVQLVELNAEASRFRMLAIKCATDLKLTQKDYSALPSCSKLSQFIGNNLDDLDDRLFIAQDEAKLRGVQKGQSDPQLRSDLQLIMSARSHLNIATMVVQSTK